MISYVLTGIKYVLLILFSLVCLYPIIWLILNSFKTSDQLFADPWGFPKTLMFNNYQRAFEVGQIGRYFMNSVIVTTIAVAVATVLSTMVAYAVTRMKWKLAKPIKGLFLLGMMIPAHSVVIPLFSMFNQIRINNTYLAVIIPHVTFSLAMAIFILSGFMSEIPHEMEEAAVIDGCSLLRIFFNIICPIAISSIVTVAVITFISVWNDLLFSQIFLSDPLKMTLPVGLNNFKGRYSTDYVGMIAAVVITIIPSIIVYITLHNKIMEGMTAGAVKG